MNRSPPICTYTGRRESLERFTYPLLRGHFLPFTAASPRSPGRTASELAEDIFGDATRTVTVRAEI
ncbi:hypothetical protein, partial [Streptomyces sp. NPDC005125]